MEAFESELADPATDPAERLIAFKLVLHLVGDLHQPLHATIPTRAVTACPWPWADRAR
nr:S1/P1 nuclease [Caulobacter hibisci]